MKLQKNIIDLSIHNNYHRGQINVALSLMGYKPESLDIYMFNNHDSLAQEGVTILSEEHLRTSGVSNVPLVKTKIRNLSPSEMNN